MKSRVATLLLCLFPLLGMAQALPTLMPPAASGATPLVDQLLALDASGRKPLEHGAPVLPIWSGANGQLLAVVALPRGWVDSPLQLTPAYGGPSAWQLEGSSVVGGGGLRWQSGDGLRAEAMFGQYARGSSAPCNPGDCDAYSAAQWSQTALSGLLGMGWSSADGGVDLSYGISWLQAPDRGASPFGDRVLGDALIPVLTLPNAQAYSLDGEKSLYARSRWRLDQGASLDLGASYARGRLSPLDAPGNFSLAPNIDLEQLSLSLGLDAGSLRGAIVGHVLSSDDPALAGKRWTTLDLGISWRTPWSGELSVGAQNLWVAPTSSPRETDSQARTPYIQYRQDL